jgi:hypothetical protein
MKSVSAVLLSTLFAASTVQGYQQLPFNLFQARPEVQARDLFTSIQSIFHYTVFQAQFGYDLYDGIVLGLQANSSNYNHGCYQSWKSLQAEIVKMPAYFNAIASNGGGQNTVIDQITTVPWYQPGTYFKLFKRIQELGALVFAMYDLCFIDDLVIAVGRTVNSFSGGFSTATTLVTYVVFDLLSLNQGNSDLNTMMNFIEKNNGVSATLSVNDQAQGVGKSYGRIFTKIFNMQVPDVQYNQF